MAKTKSKQAQVQGEVVTGHMCMQLSCLCYGFQHCAGAAQNNGGMASSKVVVSKDAGFAMLAKSLSDTLGYPIDKQQARNKFSYLERKFHAAKTWHRTSGVGISDDDRACGLSCAFLLHVKT
jgi:phosphoribosylpyrophosphate synthetase